MPISKAFTLSPLLLYLFIFPCSSQASEVSHRLAVGATYKGGQVHWGFAKKWALEVRMMKGKQTSNEGTITATVAGLRGYRYLRGPRRLRFYLGIEGASAHSESNTTDYKTTGFAAGGFGGTEIYLMKRLSVGVDVGPYLLSTKVRRSNTTGSEVYMVINSYLNFYFL